MGVRILSMGKWLAAASVMIAVSAMAQDPKKTTDRPAAESPAPANTAQPAARQGNIASAGKHCAACGASGQFPGG